MGSVVKYNPQHLVTYGAWLRNKEVPAEEARALCLKECPEDDPGVKNVEGWLVRFADPVDPWVPPGGHLLAKLDEMAVARNLFSVVIPQVANENVSLKAYVSTLEQKSLALANELAEKTKLLEDAEEKVKELLANAEKKPDLGIRQFLEL